MSNPPPTALSFPLAQSRAAFLAQAQRFTETVGSLDDRALLAASRCHGWAVVDVVVHVRAGLEEMLRGVVALTGSAPTVDAASYWAAWVAGTDPAAEVDGILWTRRTAAAYARPTGAVEHLRDATAAITAAARRMPDQTVEFQGHVMTAGDFLASWAVELCVHHLDLGRDLETATPDPDALRLTRATVASLLGAEPAADLSDLEVALIGSGRRSPDPDHPGLRCVFT